MRTVRILLQIILQSLLRTAYQGVGPILVNTLEHFQMRHDRVTMRLFCVLIGVEITLQHHRVAALHCILVGFLLLVAVGIIVEIIQDSANQNREDQRDNQNASGTLLLGFLLGFILWIIAVFSISISVSAVSCSHRSLSYRRNRRGRRSRGSRRINRSCWTGRSRSFR